MFIKFEEIFRILVKFCVKFVEILNQILKKLEYSFEDILGKLRRNFEKTEKIF